MEEGRVETAVPAPTIQVNGIDENPVPPTTTQGMDITKDSVPPPATKRKGIAALSSWAQQEREAIAEFERVKNMIADLIPHLKGVAKSHETVMEQPGKIERLQDSAKDVVKLAELE